MSTEPSNAIDRLRDQLRAQLAKAQELLRAALPHIPAGAFHGDVLSQPLDEVRLVHQVSLFLDDARGGAR